MMEKKLRNEKYMLLVEDNEDDIFLTQKAFQECQAPNKLVVVTDGKEALDFLFGRGKYANRDVSHAPSVVLLDLKLPYVSGQEVLRQIRLSTDYRNLPVVVLSSTTNMTEVEECEKIGIMRFYRKPGNFEQFAKIIEEICHKWLKENQLQFEITQ